MLGQNVLDVLIYLFETYSDESHIQPPDRAELELELGRAGFQDSAIERALVWIDDLTHTDGVNNFPLPTEIKSDAVTPSVRVFTCREKARMRVECRGYILHLEQIGILSQEQRERVIDRVMALDNDDIDLEELQWVVLMVLFSQPEQESAFELMEDLIYMQNGGIVH